MTKTVGAIVSFGTGLLIVFYYLIGQKEETKAELRQNNSVFERKELEFDKKMFMSKHFLALKNNNQAEATYYKEQADLIDQKIKDEELKTKLEKEKLEKLKEDTKNLYDETKQAVQERKE